MPRLAPPWPPSRRDDAKLTGPAVGQEEKMLKIVFWTVAILACGLFALTVWYVAHEVKSYE